MYAQWVSQKTLRKHKDPITGNSVILIFTFLVKLCFNLFTEADTLS